MTKRIRVENADCNDKYRVEVLFQDLTENGWVTSHREELHCIQLRDTHIHTHRRIVVQEITGIDTIDYAKEAESK
jgi:hypothetical protein